MSRASDERRLPPRGRRPFAEAVGGAQLSGHADGGPASKRIIVGYGFWIFLLSDIVMFSAFFATYAVLSDATAGGPSGKDLFDLDQRRDRDRLPAALELHLRHRQHRRTGAQRGSCTTAAWR